MAPPSSAQARLRLEIRRRGLNHCSITFADRNRPLNSGSCPRLAEQFDQPWQKSMLEAAVLRPDCERRLQTPMLGSAVSFKLRARLRRLLAPLGVGASFLALTVAACNVPDFDFPESPPPAMGSAGEAPVVVAVPH